MWTIRAARNRRARCGADLFITAAISWVQSVRYQVRGSGGYSRPQTEVFAPSTVIWRWYERRRAVTRAVEDTVLKEAKDIQSFNEAPKDSEDEVDMWLASL